VINGYTLAFGGLLLLGGRAGDLFGRRRVFIIGILIFTLASLLGGFANSEAWLIGARVLQGAGAAIASPTALALVTTTFPEGPPRNRAMAVYAAMSGAGAAVGLIAGGLLTDYLSWRWVLFVNVPIGLFVAYLAPRVLGESKPVHGEIDVLGAAVGTVGLTTLVFGITRAGNPDYGFGDAVVVASFVIAAILLAFFLLIESRAEHPIMPLRLFADRNRSGSYAVMLLVGAAMFAMFYFLSLFVQQILGYSPVKAGLAFLPFTIGIVIGAGVASQLAPRLAPRVIAGAGLAMATVGIFWFGQLDVSSSYLDGLLWPMLVTSVGMGLAFVALTLTAVSGVAQHESGIASALLNTMQQVGGSLGLAALATIATTAANDRLPHADLAFFAAIKSGSAELFAKAAEALTRGYTVAFMVGSIMTLAGLVITVLAINAKKQRATEDEQAPAAQLG
jgi:EmrB/QacA subfamily drug resistance transporter